MAKNQYVYVMNCTDGLYKIGRSCDPDRRCGDLERSRGDSKMSVIYKCGPYANAAPVEFGAHALLGEVRMSGEWFKCTEEEAINAVKKSSIGFVEEDIMASNISDGMGMLRYYEFIGYMCENPGKWITYIEMQEMLESMQKISENHKSEIEAMENKLIEASKTVNSYTEEARQSNFLTRRALSALERKDKEIAELKSKLSAIQPSLLN